MPYEIVPRVVPNSATYIHFTGIPNDSLTVINLGNWKNEKQNITARTIPIIGYKRINIYFPIFDKFFVKSYKCENGFSFHLLIQEILRCGIQAAKYDIKNNPTNWSNNTTPSDAWGASAITSSQHKSDLQIYNNNIYISLQS
jgi:hypothetical protein